MDVIELDRRPTAIDPDDWMINLASWVIQDGNYDDFRVGAVRRFAVEFWTDDLLASTTPTKSAASLGDGRYEINADVAYVDNGLLMLDIGLVVYKEVRPDTASPSGWVKGVVGLGIDPFFYFETHAKRRDVPPAIYSWCVTGIWRETAPWISGQIPGVGTAMVRDKDQLSWAWLDRTDAWADDNGEAEYLLRCRVLPVPPSRDIHQR
jgi:hypothetical protein